MAEPIIRVECVGKKYQLGIERHDTLRDRLTHFLRAPFRRSASAPQDFWALHDVSFEVGRGEVIGIIGRNGAGKSTLLKILSRITEPTRGRVSIRGRVASLLEVGTGFHPELTGRENIFLNGAILGMSRQEIRRKFDEIVAFAEVDRFVDTAVKHYSSGMYVRLAFAVAAHLEPEILVVDEVLAVGDAQFQKKCLGKMQSVASDEGRTILFVSHNMAAIQHLCSRGVLLSQGRVLKVGPIDHAVAAYLADGANGGPQGWHYRQRNPWLRITAVELRSTDDQADGVLAGQPLTIRVRYECDTPDRFKRGVGLSITLRSEDRKVTNLWSAYQPGFQFTPEAQGCVECLIPAWPFRDSSFSVDVYTDSDNQPLEWIQDCASFESHDGDFFRSGRMTNRGEGFVFIPHHWSSHAGK